LLDLIELNDRSDGVSGAAIQSALAINWRAMLTKIGTPRQGAQ
jgi:hypothetical protein